MKNLLFDFDVDKSSKSVSIRKEFNAPQQLVWDAFTRKDILDKWWAPKPWESQTKIMDFEVGGQRFYAMVSPEGDKHWSLQKFTSISPIKNFKMLNAFANENAEPDLPGSTWDLSFEEKDGITTVSILIFNESRERMEQMIEMGFQGGFTMTLNYLDTLLSDLSSQ